MLAAVVARYNQAEQAELVVVAEVAVEADLKLTTADRVVHQALVVVVEQADTELQLPTIVQATQEVVVGAAVESL
jgi:hypothetical protein